MLKGQDSEREMGNITALAQISDLMLGVLAELVAEIQEMETEASWLLAIDCILELTAWPADRHK